jgi:hypothetical protein
VTVSGVNVSGLGSGTATATPAVALVACSAVAASGSPSGAVTLTPAVAAVTVSGLTASAAGVGTATAVPAVATVTVTASPTPTPGIAEIPFVYTLTVTDREDGTGADATAGDTGGDAVNLFRRRVSGGLNATDWTFSGTRVGNGTIAVNTTTKGYYWWILSGPAEEFSNLVYEPITDGADALHQRILDAVEAVVDSLALEGIDDTIAADPGGGVIQLKVPFNERLTLPCVLLTAFGLAETMRGQVNSQDDLGYPIQVSFLANDAQRQETQERGLKWREQVSRALRYQRLAGVDEVYTVEPEPDPVFALEGTEQLQYVVSTIAFRVVTREPRGFGA